MLHKIVAKKKQEIADIDSSVIELATQLAQRTGTNRLFRQRLIQSVRPVSIIAEVKKASPSRGVIRSDFDPVLLASAYEQARVETISVLTDRTFFQGDNGYLTEIRTHVKDTPLLRKEFIIDEIQIYEAKVIGADCVLLIAAILEGEQLESFHRLATQLGMDVLVEVHDEQELDKVLSRLTPGLLGINNRDLKTFSTSLDTSERLIAGLPSSLREQMTIISESGISSPGHIERLAQLGVRGVLVGEHLMRQKEIVRAVHELVGDLEEMEKTCSGPK